MMCLKNVWYLRIKEMGGQRIKQRLPGLEGGEATRQGNAGQWEKEYSAEE